MAQQATVLILADIGDPERAALEAACSEAGFAPSVEGSAEAATGKLTAKRFDALIVHLGTPGAALACMRARGKLLRARIPVIALVDAEDETTFARAYRAGADEVLPLACPQWLAARLRGLPRSTIPQPGHARGDAVVADADRTRAEVIERVLKDSGFRVEVAVDGFSTRLQAGRPSLKVAVVDASLDDVPNLIHQAKAKGARCAWVVRARPEQLEDLRQKLTRIDRVSVLSAYGPPDDVLFEINRLVESRTADGRGDERLLHGAVLRLCWASGAEDIGYSYNVSASGLFVRTLMLPPTEKLSLEMTVPGGSDKIHLECEVVWRREFGATKKEPVPAGFALHIVGGDLVAWTRALPRTSLPPLGTRASNRAPSAEKPAAAKPAAEKPSREKSAAEKPAAGAVRVPVPGQTEIEIKPRAAPSVEKMLASVLSESAIDTEDSSGSAPLDIDSGAVVDLHAMPPSEAATNDEVVTKVQPSPLQTEGGAPYTVESARQEVLADALDATKTPLAVPRVVERPPPPRVEPKASVVPRPSGSRVDSKADKAAPRPSTGEDAAANPAQKKAASGSSVEPRRKSDRPPSEAGGLDISDITPASIGFDLSEDGRIIEAVRRLPPVEKKPDSALRGSARPSPPARPSMQSPGRGGTLAGTGPVPFELMAKDRSAEASSSPKKASGSVPPPSDPARALERGSVPARPESVPPSDPARALERGSVPARPGSVPPSASDRGRASPESDRATLAAPASARDSTRPAEGPGDRAAAPRSPASAAPAAGTSPSERALAPTVHPFAQTGLPEGSPSRTESAKPPSATTQVVADAGTADTMRPSTAGLPEDMAARALAAPRVPAFAPPHGGDAANGARFDDLVVEPPKKRRSLGKWIAVAAVLGGGAALLATPSFRKLSPEPAPEPQQATVPAPASADPGMRKASDTERLEAPSEPSVGASAVPGASAAAAVAAVSAAPGASAALNASAATEQAAPGASGTAAPAGSASGSEVDEAALALLKPGQGYLYVASPLATNVFLYGILAGTTNERIITKCGPRFIRLGTTLGNWQGEGVVQIVKCGALTRVEMGGE